MAPSKPLINLLRTRNVDILKQLQIEERLFHTSEESFFILNHGAPKQAVVMGSYNDPKTLLNINNILQFGVCISFMRCIFLGIIFRDDIPVIRRFSGGGTVFVDDNCYFMSILTSAKEIGLKQFDGKYIGPREIMQWTNTLLNPVFNHLDNLEFSILEHVDYVLSEKENPSNIKKIAGNAQKISRDRFDHHTSWLWNYNIDLINKYLAVPPTKNQPEYRKNRSHKDFLLCLNELFERDIENLERRLLNQLDYMFDIKEISFDQVLGMAGNLNEDHVVNGKQINMKTRIIYDELVSMNDTN